jgi:glucokinase
MQANRSMQIDPISVQTITGAARQGDALTQAIIDRAADYLAQAVNMVVSMLDIPLVIIGGEVVEMGEVFFEPFRQSLAKYRGAEPPIQGVPAILGENAAIQGMGIIVLESALMNMKEMR